MKGLNHSLTDPHVEIETESLSPTNSSLGNSEDLPEDSFVKFSPERLKNITRSLASSVRQRLAKQKSSVPVREPIENPRKVVGENFSKEEKVAAQWAKVVPFEKFNANLQVAFGKAITRIRNLPPKQRKYIVVSDQFSRKPKSTTWMKGLLAKQIEEYPPTDFVKPGELNSYLISHPEVSHVVLMDDGAYSGNQMAETITSITKNGVRNKQSFHVVVPYMTSIARNKIKTALGENSHYLYDTERMLSYTEHAQAQTPSNDYRFKKDTILNLPETGDQKIDSELQTLKVSIKNSSSVLSDSKSKQVIEFLRKLNGEKSAVLAKAIYSAHRKPGFFANLIDRVTNPNLSKFIEDSERTPTWMAHKAADDMSTDFDAMEKLVSPRPMAPYKDDEQVGKNVDEVDNTFGRLKQILRLKSNMPGRTIQDTVAGKTNLAWLPEKVDFVQSNRGFFLIGDNYGTNSQTQGVSILHNGKSFTLGGSKGEYQYRIQEGDRFIVTNPKNPNQKVTLQLKEGKLIIDGIDEHAVDS